MYFGPNAGGLQERWFVTENNVAEFLGHVSQPPSSGPPEVEQCPLIEVLDVSEGQSLIRLKASDRGHFQPEPLTEHTQSPQNSSKLSADAENGPVQKSTDSLPARETMGRVGRGPGHCVVLDPPDPRLAVPEKPLTCQSNESEQDSTARQEAVSVTPAQPRRKEPAQTSEVKGVHSESTRSKPGLSGTPVAPVIKETNMQDGRVEYISHHATRCPITFQNSLLYELD
ncbi:hypothetical protein JRQ81_001283 [Phrynocephalus forsythii]|uniref:Uncharacterized protein n=1 Tax=Phrynocephalus forsythii TaxID=171643 RepID=A0A9Q1B7R0_9SAUR|nr:hypothetical protein JRQ81_001283 [Phrynocephalus forsythii]